MEVDLGKSLVGVTALAAAFAALATATGAFDQMQRDQPGWSAAVFGLAVFAGALVVAAGIVTNKTLEAALVFIALAAFAIAAVIGIVILIQAQGDRPPPTIKVQFKDQPKLRLSGTIAAEEMSSKESMKVSVLAQTPSSNKDPNGGGREDSLFKARLGSDAAGKIDLPLEVPIPPNKYRWATVLAWVSDRPAGCFATVPAQNFKNTPGCVIMRVPGAK